MVCPGQIKAEHWMLQMNKPSIALHLAMIYNFLSFVSFVAIWIVFLLLFFLFAQLVYPSTIKDEKLAYFVFSARYNNEMQAKQVCVLLKYVDTNECIYLILFGH